MKDMIELNRYKNIFNNIKQQVIKSQYKAM